MISLAVALAVFGHDHYISRDAGWCWFADPRAIWVNGKILAGGVSGQGDVSINLYDPKTKSAELTVIAPKFEKDDHDNPAFLPLPNNEILAFYSKHTGPSMFLTTATKDNPLKWSSPVELKLNDPTYKGPKGALNAYTYPNPQLLSAEKNRIYLFWRGMNWKPTLSTSDDLGKTWSKGKILIAPESDSPGNRPYVKVSGNGRSAIHLAFTDGHPRNEATNSIYYLRYEKGAMRSADGKAVARMNQLPVRPHQADVVYDGKAEGVRSWIWDVAEDSKGNPVITYSRLPKQEEHYYRYARWDGRRWVDRQITFGGKWFPQTPQGKTEPEPHYSGGVVLDPKDTRFVYLSRPINGRFEIERWFTPDGGDSWSHVAITGKSKHDSVRPFVIRGDRPVGGPNALWVNASRYTTYQDYQSTIQGANEEFGQVSEKDPLKAADAVWKWVRSNPSPYPKFEWMLAPLLAGVFDYSEYRKEPEAANWLRAEGEANGYKMGPRPGMADDVAVGQAFIQLYMIDRKPEQLAPVQSWIDGWMGKPHDTPLLWVNGVHNSEMAWCDALFMAPPTMALLSKATGDPRYANKMADLWWKTSDYLYDPIEHLYFRDSRYFEPREANGKKVFWSRGNGWVLAGLARVLMHLPADFDGRGKLEIQFKQMATRVAGLQTPDGTWHASLLDPASFPHPETSGTAFYVYAMAWGVNNGLLPRAEFESVINKGFAALCGSVDPNGRLGWVQPIGQDPRVVKYTDTDAYGVGGFLLAAGEVAKFHRRS